MATEKRNTQGMTATEALSITRELLGNISIPSKYKAEINAINDAMDNLTVIAQMIENEKQAIIDRYEKKEAPDAEDHNEERDA